MHKRLKGLMIILDGLGDRSISAFSGATPLEAAATPWLDGLLAESCCGMVDPLEAGMPVGTHTGTGLLLGLTPADARHLSRGPVEAAGIGMTLEPGDVALRCNFATLRPEENGFQIVDRRAGRIRQGTDALAAELGEIPLGQGISAVLEPATEHRAVLRLTGPGLSAEITNTDPSSRATISQLLRCRPLHDKEPAAELTAEAINRFVVVAHEKLRAHPVNQQREARGLLPANGIITRGAGLFQTLTSIPAHFGLSTALVAGERTVLGLGRLFGYSIVTQPTFTASLDTNLEAKVEATQAALSQHDLVFLHIKGPDLCSHDRDPQCKKEFLERVDKSLESLSRDDMVIAVSGDHSTDSNTGSHCGDPVPSLFFAPHGRRDSETSFGEGSCMRGGLGRITATSLLLTLLDHMGHLGNYRSIDRFLLNCR